MRTLILFCLSLFLLQGQEMPESKQLLVVTTENWSISSGVMQRFERHHGSWEKVGDAIEIELGRNGLGWGIGLHDIPKEAKIIKKEGKLYFDEGNFRVRIVEGMYDALKSYIDKRVILGVRAEDIHDKLFASEAPPENIVTMTSEVVEHLGSEVYIHMNTGKHILVAKASGDTSPQINQDMDVVFDMSKIHFFDKATEKTII